MTRVVVALLAAAALGVAGWVFAQRHADPVTVDLLVHSWDAVPLWLALLAAFLCGALLMGVVAFYEGLRARLMRRRFRKMVDGLESEIHQLRNLPLAPEGSTLASGSPAPDEGLAVPGESLHGSA